MLTVFVTEHIIDLDLAATDKYADAHQAWVDRGNVGPEPKDESRKYRCWDGINMDNFLRHYFLMHVFESGYLGKDSLSPRYTPPACV